MPLDERLAPMLGWNPIPGGGGDPGPEVYMLFHGLDRARQVQIVSAVIEARVRISEVTAQTYKNIGNILSKAG